MTACYFTVRAFLDIRTMALGRRSECLSKNQGWWSTSQFFQLCATSFLFNSAKATEVKGPQRRSGTVTGWHQDTLIFPEHLRDADCMDSYRKHNLQCISLFLKVFLKNWCHTEQWSRTCFPRQVKDWQILSRICTAESQDEQWLNPGHLDPALTVEEGPLYIGGRTVVKIRS